MTGQLTIGSNFDGTQRGAVLSECETYRYRLWRINRERGTGAALFVGCNPSTADAIEDDHTIRKLRGFTSRWGLAGFEILNVCAYRSRAPKALLGVADPVGPDNATHIKRAILDACCSVDPLVIVMWGEALPKPLRHHAATLVATLRGAGAHPMCFGLTGSGQPMHPLTLAYDAPLVPFAGNREWGQS